MNRAAAVGSLPDDLRAGAGDDPDQLVLLLLRHVELVERLHEVPGQRVELGVGDVHAGVGRDVEGRAQPMWLDERQETSELMCLPHSDLRSLRRRQLRLSDERLFRGRRQRNRHD